MQTKQIRPDAMTKITSDGHCVLLFQSRAGNIYSERFIGL